MNEQKDILNREKYILQLVDLVEGISKKKSSYCFAIEGQWGVGKTFILKIFEEHLKTIQLEETADNKYFVFHYNCWEYDYYDEPSVAIVSSMIDNLSEQEKIVDTLSDIGKACFNKAKDIMINVGREFVKNKIGVDIVGDIKDIFDDTKEIGRDKHDFDVSYTFKKTLDKTRDKLKELSTTKSIVFVVDEMDRCLPEYAIKVMERIHHLFYGIENITVILAVDKTQLTHSIKKIYGDSVDIDRYLKKFIDFSVFLDRGEISGILEEKYYTYLQNFIFIKHEDKDLFYEMFRALFNDIDIRTQEKIIEKAELIHELIKTQNKYDLSLACFEIIALFLIYKTKQNDISKIIQAVILSNSIHIEYENSLGSSAWGFLVTNKNIYNEKIIQTALKPYEKLKDNIMGKAIWLLAGTHDKYNTTTCGKYWLEKEEQPINEMALVSKFVSIAEMMA